MARAGGTGQREKKQLDLPKPKPTDKVFPAGMPHPGLAIDTLFRRQSTASPYSQVRRQQLPAFEQRRTSQPPPVDPLDNFALESLDQLVANYEARPPLVREMGFFTDLVGGTNQWMRDNVPLVEKGEDFTSSMIWTVFDKMAMVAEVPWGTIANMSQQFPVMATIADRVLGLTPMGLLQKGIQLSEQATGISVPLPSVSPAQFLTPEQRAGAETLIQERGVLGALGAEVDKARQDPLGQLQAVIDNPRETFRSMDIGTQLTLGIFGDPLNLIGLGLLKWVNAKRLTRFMSTWTGAGGQAIPDAAAGMRQLLNPFAETRGSQAFVAATNARDILRRIIAGVDDLARMEGRFAGADEVADGLRAALDSPAEYFARNPQTIALNPDSEGVGTAIRVLREAEVDGVARAQEGVFSITRFQNAADGAIDEAADVLHFVGQQELPSGLEGLLALGTSWWQVQRGIKRYLAIPWLSLNWAYMKVNAISNMMEGIIRGTLPFERWAGVEDFANRTGIPIARMKEGIAVEWEAITRVGGKRGLAAIQDLLTAISAPGRRVATGDVPLIGEAWYRSKYVAVETMRGLNRWMRRGLGLAEPSGGMTAADPGGLTDQLYRSIEGGKALNTEEILESARRISDYGLDVRSLVDDVENVSPEFLARAQGLVDDRLPLIRELVQNARRTARIGAGPREAEAQATLMRGMDDLGDDLARLLADAQDDVVSNLLAAGEAPSQYLNAVDEALAPIQRSGGWANFQDRTQDALNAVHSQLAADFADDPNVLLKLDDVWRSATQARSSLQKELMGILRNKNISALVRSRVVRLHHYRIMRLERQLLDDTIAFYAKHGIDFSPPQALMEMGEFRLADAAAASAGETARFVQKITDAVTETAKVPAGETEGWYIAVREWLKAQGGASFNDTLLLSSKFGEGLADRILLNYNVRRNFDYMLDAFIPFSYWFTRKAAQYAQRIFIRPWAMMFPLRLQEHIRDVAESDEVLPQRLRDQLRVMEGTILEPLGRTNLYADVLRTFFPMYYVYPFAELLDLDWEEDELRKANILERFAAQPAFFGIRPYPHVRWALERAGPERRGIDPAFHNIPLARHLWAASVMARHFIPGGKEIFPLGGIDVESDLRNLAGLDDVPTTERVYWTPMWTAFMFQDGQISEDQAWEALRSYLVDGDSSSSVIQSAWDMASFQRALPEATNLVGVRVNVFTDMERGARESRHLYGDMKTGGATSDNLREYLDQNPAVPLQWAIFAYMDEGPEGFLRQYENRQIFLRNDEIAATAVDAQEQAVLEEPGNRARIFAIRQQLSEDRAENFAGLEIDRAPTLIQDADARAKEGLSRAIWHTRPDVDDFRQGGEINFTAWRAAVADWEEKIANGELFGDEVQLPIYQQAWSNSVQRFKDAGLPWGRVPDWPTEGRPVMSWDEVMNFVGGLDGIEARFRAEEESPIVAIQETWDQDVYDRANAEASLLRTVKYAGEIEDALVQTPLSIEGYPHPSRVIGAIIAVQSGGSEDAATISRIFQGRAVQGYGVMGTLPYGDITPAQLQDAETGIAAGVRALRQRLVDSKGDLRAALYQFTGGDGYWRSDEEFSRFFWQPFRYLYQTQTVYNKLWDQGSRYGWQVWEQRWDRPYRANELVDSALELYPQFTEQQLLEAATKIGAFPNMREVWNYGKPDDVATESRIESAAYDLFDKARREAGFPDEIYILAEMYSRLDSDDQKKAFLERFPVLREFWDWSDEFWGDHPQDAKAIGREIEDGDGDGRSPGGFRAARRPFIPQIDFPWWDSNVLRRRIVWRSF